jgi:subtilisin family serine protease
VRKTSLVLTLSLAAVQVVAGPSLSGTSGWEFLSRTDIGAKAFTDAHPEWDGRGVLIAVCDTGVELDTAGLQTTSDGKPKILDARVFCSEARIDLEKAETGADEHGAAIHAKGGKWLYGLDKLPMKPPKDAEILVGYFKEEDVKNSDAKGGDLNNNGRSNDVFGLVVFKSAEGKWIGFVDTNGDGDLGDEQPVGDFSETRQSFQLRGRNLHDAPNLMTFALNLWPDEKKAALFMADGSHGTHVAGICAGRSIGGQVGFDGIAPGAQILALKIGNNTLSGGSTTPGSMLAAWRYAVKRAKELDMPLVIQMSFGVGSEQEGKSVAEKLIDELLGENPGVVATVSNGNEGPGLSTSGLPACARSVIAVGAVLNRASARDLYGVSLTQDEMFAFSSRGGEVDRPSVVAPGFASSTVPAYEEGRDVFRGTSMASPQAAGACALLLSAARAQRLPVRRDLCKSAVERGAAPISGYGPDDQGHGLIDVPHAWGVYQALASRNASHPLAYKVETESPEMADHKGPAIYWRGDFFPDPTRTQEITVKPVFPPDASADFKAGFYQAFDVTVDASWLSVEKDAAYIKAEQPARIPVRFNAAGLSRPGCYQAVLRGYAKGGGDREKLGPEWSVPVTVVVPEKLDPARQLGVERTVDGLKPAKVERLFFEVSSGVGSVGLDIRLAAGTKNTVQVYLFDPEGRHSRSGALRPDRDRFVATIGPADLEPGVWELDLYANYANTSTASVKAVLQGFPVGRTAPDRATVSLGQGQSPSGTMTLTSGPGQPIRGEGRGTVVGNVTDTDVKLHAATWSKSFGVAPGEAGVTFELSVSAEDFNLFTDTAVQVLDSDGKALSSEGLTYRKATLEFDPPGGAKPDATYTLKVTAATADPGVEPPSWTLHLGEVHRYADPVAIAVTSGKEGKLALYPNHEVTLTLQLKAVPPALPAGAAWLAEVTLKDSERETLQLPLELRLEPGKPSEPTKQ